MLETIEELDAEYLKRFATSRPEDLAHWYEEHWTSMQKGDPRKPKEESKPKPSPKPPIPQTVTVRTCRDCGVQLTKKPGRGRWPVKCLACR